VWHFGNGRNVSAPSKAWSKLGASDRVQVPVGKGLANHPYRVCSGVVSDDEEISVSEMIEKGKVEIAGNSYDLYFNSVISYKYDGENVVERLDDSMKIVNFYDEEMLTKQEVYSSDRLIATVFFTYDSSGKEIRKESIIEATKDKTYNVTSYEKNYKEISYYDSNDELSLVGEVVLNDKQQMIKFSSKSNDGTLESVGHYEYEDDKLIFHQSTGDHGVIREIYYRYNEYGDEVSVIAITYSGKKSLDAMYYDNEYDDLKLVRQTEYTVHAELDEKQISDIVKSLK